MALITNNISGSASNNSKVGITGSVIIANAPASSFPGLPGSDTTFFVSGSINNGGGRSVFGGDVIVSGSLTASVGGDLQGSLPNPTISKLQSTSLSIPGTPATGQVLQWNGSAWVPGALAEGGAGGGGVIYYLNYDITGQNPTGLNGVKQLGLTASLAQTSTTTAVTNAGYSTISNFVTDLNNPNITSLPAGVWDFNVWASTDSNQPNDTFIKAGLYKSGSTGLSLIASSSITYLNYQSTEYQYVVSLTSPKTTMVSTDRLLVALSGSTTNPSHNITVKYGNGTPSHVHSTVPSVGGTGIVHVVDGIIQTPATPVNLSAGSAEIIGTLPVGNGGTGTSTTPSQGSLLIGNNASGYNVANLSQGSNVTITNGNGSITVAVPAAGSDTQVQFNDGGTTFGGASGLTYNKTNQSLTASGNVAINGGSLTTTAGTFNLINSNATTLNVGGGATTINLGNSAGTNNISGATKFSQGLSGSLTKLVDGTSYIAAGPGIVVNTSSLGQVSISSSLGTSGSWWSGAAVGSNNQVLTADGSGGIVAEGNLSFDGGTLTVTGNAVVTGDVTINGNTTTVNTNNLEVKDAVIGLGFSSGTIAVAAGDRGWIGGIAAGQNVMAKWDNAAGEFALARTTSSATGSFGIASYANLHTANVQANIVTASNGFSGSLTRLADGTSYIVAGGNMTVASSSNGPITLSTINSGTIHGVTAGTGLTGGGTSGTVTLGINTGVVATVTGTVFTGPVSGTIFYATTGFSGSLTQLTNGGGPYIVAGPGITISTSSIGQVSISSSLGTSGSWWNNNARGSNNNVLTADGLGGIFAESAFNFDGSRAYLSGSLVATVLSGSLTKLADGTSYLVAGPNITITSQSNGSIAISGSTPTFYQWNELSPSPRLNTTASVAIAGGRGSSWAAQSTGADVFFYVSGTIDGVSVTGKHAVFGGDLIVSGGVQQGNLNTALGLYSHAQGQNTTTGVPFSVNLTGPLYVPVNNQGTGSHAEGFQTYAFGDFSHAEGEYTVANNDGSHAEGIATVTSGAGAHSEGTYTTAKGIASHAEGAYTLTIGNYSHSEGLKGITVANYSHVEGSYTLASGSNSHAEGKSTVAIGAGSHAEGGGGSDADYGQGDINVLGNYNTTAYGNYSHAEGYRTLSRGPGSHSEGNLTVAYGDYSHAEGYQTFSSGSYSHAEGYYVIASGSYSHAEGEGAQATGQSSHAEGYQTVASGPYSHAEGGGWTYGDFPTYAKGGIATGKGAHAEGQFTRADGVASHSEGVGVQASGDWSHAEGYYTKATNSYAHSEGYGTQATGYSSHAEGEYTVASNQYSHTEGSYNLASGYASHAEGFQTTGSADYSHAEGYSTFVGTDPGGFAPIPTYSNTSTGIYGHSEGIQTRVYNDGGHAEGFNSKAGGAFSHAEGSGTYTSGSASHAEGLIARAYADYSHAEGRGSTTATGYQASHAEGYYTIASGSYSHAEGYQTKTSKTAAHAEGYYTIASGSYSHAEGYQTTTLADYSHAEGNQTTSGYIEPSLYTVYGAYSHVEGTLTIAESEGSHAEGYQTTAGARDGIYSPAGNYSHAEGNQTVTYSAYSHAEGVLSTTRGIGSHAEGYSTDTYGNYSHAEGDNTITYGDFSRAVGSGSVANGKYSYAAGFQTRTYNDSQAAFGKWNKSTGGANNIFVIGNGTSDVSRSDIFVVDNSTVQVTGSLIAPKISGSLQRLSDGTTSYLIGAGTVTVSTGASGQITITGGGGGSSIFSTSGVEAKTTYAASFSTNNVYPSSIGSDVYFYVSGSISGSGTADDKSVFGGDVYISGALQNGFRNKAWGTYSHAEGSFTTANGNYSHAEGDYSVASGDYSHAEGGYFGGISHIAGGTASGYGSHAEGEGTTASNFSSHAEGANTTASGIAAHSEGYYTKANGNYAHVEGYLTTGSNSYSHAEGERTTASGIGSHAEGYQSVASGDYSHAEGAGSSFIGTFKGGTASGVGSHAEGWQTTSFGIASHAEGYASYAYGDYSHAEGQGSYAYGNGSHAEGAYTIASGSNQTVVGQYNKRNNTTSLFVVGNGSNDSDFWRSDILRVETSSVQVTGSLAVSGTYYSTSGNRISSDALLQSSLLYLSSIT